MFVLLLIAGVFLVIVIVVAAVHAFQRAITHNDNSINV